MKSGFQTSRRNSRFNSRDRLLWRWSLWKRRAMQKHVERKRKILRNREVGVILSLLCWQSEGKSWVCWPPRLWFGHLTAANGWVGFPKDRNCQITYDVPYLMALTWIWHHLKGQYTQKNGSQWGPANIWLPTIYKISSFNPINTWNG